MEHLTLREFILSLAIAFALSFVPAFGRSRLEGTYINVNGVATLELRSGGKASITVLADTEACTYNVDGKKLHLACNEGKVDFTIHDDGSLTPDGALIGTMRKSQS